jgi:hypothetical protein
MYVVDKCLYAVLGAGLVMQHHRPTKWLPAAMHFKPPPIIYVLLSVKLKLIWF